MTFMFSIWLPTRLSAVIVFVSSSIIHMVLPWHKNDYPRVPHEDAVMDALRPGISSGACCRRICRRTTSSTLSRSAPSWATRSLFSRGTAARTPAANSSAAVAVVATSRTCLAVAA